MPQLSSSDICQMDIWQGPVLGIKSDPCQAQWRATMAVATCCFCERTVDQVTHLIQGPSLFICDIYQGPELARAPNRPSLETETQADGIALPVYQCSKMSTSGQPATSRRARVGRKRKAAWASSVRPSRSKSASSLALSACKYSTSDAA